jgi:Increased loss of mitochondrial DNA protein 1
MGLINGNTIIRSLSLFHITIGFFFLTSPRTVADQSLVFVLGEAMKLVS